MTEIRRGGPTRLVLFDLGGVLVDLGGLPELATLAGLELGDFWSRWLACPWVRDYERGRCDTAAFARGVVDSWGLAARPEEFLDVFARWPRGLFPGVRQALGALRGRVRTAVLSNTNALHWERQGGEWGLDRLVDEHFLSFRTGLTKPDAAAFEDVLLRMAVAAEEVLFLDDNLPNVEGARALGIRAEHVLGFEAARAVLEARGLL